MKKKFIILAAIIIALSIIGYFCSQCFTVTFLRAQKDYLDIYINSHYIIAVLVAILIYASVVLSTLPITAIATISSGFFFGIPVGSFITLTGATLGAITAFLIFKHFMGKDFQAHYQDKLHRFNKELSKYGVRYLIIVHFLMVIPFFLINLMAALTKIDLWTFTWTTIVGLIPSTILYTYAGSELSHINAVSDIFSWKMFAAFGIIIALILATILKDKLLKRG